MKKIFFITINVEGKKKKKRGAQVNSRKYGQGLYAYGNKLLNIIDDVLVRFEFYK